MAFEITSALELSRAFFREHPRASRLLVKDHRGTGLMFTADTRMEFAAWTDYMHREGRISENLAYSSELDLSCGVEKTRRKVAHG
jgi:hypothetical protein